MPEYKYISARAYNNNPGSIQVAIATEARQSPIIPNTRDYLLAVDRFFIQSMIVPVFEPDINEDNDTLLAITILDTNDGTAYPQVIRLDNSDNTFYNYQEIVKVLNSNVNTLWGTIPGKPVGANAPVFSFSEEKWSITTNTDFRDQYEIYFNQPLYELMHTFEFDSISVLNPSTLQYALLQCEKDVVTQFESTVELFSPVSRILIESQGIPIESELLPNIVGANSSVNNLSDNILTDYKVYTENSSCLQTILYESGSNYKWFSMNGSTNFKSFSIKFLYVNYKGEKKNILLNYKNKAEIKLVLREVE